MKKEDCEARTLIALAVGVGFGALIGAAILAAFYPIFQSKEWAAWVQAIGSVVAICAAIGIAQWQRSSWLRHKKEDELFVLVHKLTYLHAIAADAVVALEEASSDLERHQKGNRFKAELDRLIVSSRLLQDALKADCPETVVMEVLEINRQVTYAIKALKQRNESYLGFTAETLKRAERRFTIARTKFQHIALELSKVEETRNNPG